jgi:uncharacterized protein HemY
VTKEAYESVILLTLIDEARYTSQGVKNLTSQWKRLSENVYNNTQLKFELVKEVIIAIDRSVKQHFFSAPG